MSRTGRTRATNPNRRGEKVRIRSIRGHLRDLEPENALLGAQSNGFPDKSARLWNKALLILEDMGEHKQARLLIRRVGDMYEKKSLVLPPHT